MKNACIPGAGFLFTTDGLSFKDMAVKLHEHGYLTDEEMAPDGGVAALRRKIYDELFQNRLHYSKLRKPLSELTEEEKAEQAREEKLFREMNAYADAMEVNDPKYMDMVITPEDLGVFGIEVTGRNMVAAELVAKAIRVDPRAVEKIKALPSPTMLRALEVAKWILAGRPNFGRGVPSERAQHGPETVQTPDRPIKDYPLAVRRRARALARAKLDKKYPPKKPQP